jgi:hypothetical protein
MTKEVLPKEWRRMLLILQLREEFSSLLQDRRKWRWLLMFENVWKVVGDGAGLILAVVVAVGAVDYLKCKLCV